MIRLYVYHIDGGCDQWTFTNDYEAGKALIDLLKGIDGQVRVEAFLIPPPDKET